MTQKTADSNPNTIQVTLREERKFAPPDAFAAKAVVNQGNEKQLRDQGQKDPEKFWAEAAKTLHWFKPFDKTLEWDPPVAKWFLGGKLNASYNCLDRHLKTHAKKTALIWESEPGEVTHWTYEQLHQETEKATAVLRKLGLKKGDRVAIYMPMVPEAVVAMLACARGGFTHTVIFGGFSASALIDRINDAQARLVITADGGYRKGAWIKLKEAVDEALKSCPTIESSLVLKRQQAGKPAPKTTDAPPTAGKPKAPKDIDWHQALGSVSSEDARANGKAEELDSEHPLFILYTSGTTGKPKGIVHTTGGFMTGVVQTTQQVFDLRSDDIYWCTADIGWVTGHSYLVYGPLASGTTALMYEGAPNHPDAHRIWSIIERHKATILYTAPTAIRAFMKLGDLPKQHDLKSLRLLGTVGEPINPEAWMWYKDVVGGGRCPIVDTYWQTETGAIVISPLPGVTATKPGSATLPLPGYDVDVLDKKGQPVPKGEGGYLVIKKPWPSMARTIYGDPERFKKQYWSEFPGGIYFTGDGARRDQDGYIWCLGRVDDVLNVSGHRLGTMEIESALVSHPSVAEAAVVGRPDDLKGQAVVAFVTLKSAVSAKKPDLAQITAELKAHVTKEIGALARPDDIRLSDALPKTRSGKIMRRLLRELAAGGSVKGDTTTLEDFSVIAALQKDEE